MAFASVGSVASTNSSTANQASTTIAGTLTAGNLHVLIIAVDNNATVDGDEVAVTSVTDNLGGNTWTKAKEFTNGQGAAQAGATCSLWYCVAATGGSATVTINFSNATSRDKSACTMWKFSVGAGNTVAIEGTPGQLANDGADPGSLNVTTTNIQCLRIRGIASETSTATQITPTATWTAFTANTTAGGAAATNMAVRGEFLISTGTGAASDPTFTAADTASVYVAFKEVVAPVVLTAATGTFNLTGIAASFARNMVSSAGSFSLTGNNATFDTELLAGTGSFVLTGMPVEDPSSGNVTLTAETGNFSLAGQATVFKINLVSSTGTFNLTGVPVTFDRRLLASPGSFTSSGVAVNFNTKLVASTGSFNLTGIDVVLTATGEVEEVVPLVGGKMVPKSKHKVRRHTPKKSTDIKSITFDSHSNELKIRFKTDAEYSYTNVPFKVYHDIVGAKSKGKHFHNKIKGKYFYQKNGLA